MTTFIFYNAGTGVPAQVSEGHQPFERDGLSVAIFTNKTYAEAASGLFIVDLGSVEAGDPWDTCELIDNPDPPPPADPQVPDELTQARLLSRALWR